MKVVMHHKMYTMEAINAEGSLLFNCCFNYNLSSLLQKSKMSFPKCLIGNPVFVKSMAYGCPTEPFGHDKVT